MRTQISLAAGVHDLEGHWNVASSWATDISEPTLNDYLVARIEEEFRDELFRRIQLVIVLNAPYDEINNTSVIEWPSLSKRHAY